MGVAAWETRGGHRVRGQEDRQSSLLREKAEKKEDEEVWPSQYVDKFIFDWSTDDN